MRISDWISDVCSSDLLETTFETDEGAVTLTDFMPLASDEEHVNVVRLVRGDRGRVRMHCEFVLRFGYGSTAPWLQREDFGAHAVAGPDAVELHTPVSLVNEKDRKSTRLNSSH